MSISLKSVTSPKAGAEATASPTRGRDIRMTADVLTSILAAAVVLTVGAVIGFMLYGYSHANRIYEGVSVAGIEVGGMTQAEARHAIQPELASVSGHPILLASGSQEYSIDPAVSGITIDSEATLDDAFAYGRDGSIWSRTQEWADAIVSGREVPMQINVDIATVDATLQTIAADVTRPAQDAYITYGQSGEPVIVPELPGFGFDVEATRNAIVQRITNQSDNPVDLVVPIVPAAISVQDLESGVSQIKDAIASPLVVSGLDEHWGIDADGLRSMLTYRGDGDVVEVDRQAIASFVEGIASEVDQSAEDAGITVDENGKLAALSGHASISVRQDEMVNSIVEALQSGTHEVELSYDSQAPAIPDETAAAAAEKGEALLDKSVEVNWEGGTTTLDRADLLGALTVRIRTGEDDPFVFGFDGNKLAEALGSTFDEIEVAVKEPRLRLLDGKIVIAQQGASGKTVDVETSIAAIVDAAANGTGSASLTVKTVDPSLSLPVISKIFLGDVLAESSTYYGDSSDARRNNVEVASALENGWLIGPGQQFSYAEFIGDITRDQGFVTGFGIVDDPNGNGGVTTAPVIGGGVCQVSTTIFQAAFWAGLQIDERYSHPYWIQTYGEPPRGMKGLDAMVNIEESGNLDLKFTNTTPDWIAVQVIADSTVVTVRVLGTDPGWTVDVSQPTITDQVKPNTETQYTDSPELEPGSQLQVEYAQEGFTADITRVVTDKDGKVLDSGSLVSTFAPSRNTVLRGVESGGTPEAA